MRMTRPSQLDKKKRPSLMAGISRRDDSTILASPRDAIEHAPRRERNFADGFFPIALATQIGRHHAQDVGTLLDENHSRVVAHTLERAWFVRNLEIIGKLLIQDLSTIKRLEQRRHLGRSRYVFSSISRGLHVHHLAAQTRVSQ